MIKSMSTQHCAQHWTGPNAIIIDPARCTTKVMMLHDKHGSCSSVRSMPRGKVEWQGYGIALSFLFPLEAGISL